MATIDSNRELLSVIATGKIGKDEAFREGFGCLMVKVMTGIYVLVSTVEAGAPASQSYLLVSLGPSDVAAGIRYELLDFEDPFVTPGPPFPPLALPKTILVYRENFILTDADVSATLLREPAKAPPAFLAGV